MHQDDRRPPPALPQHRRLPLRLPHLPHLLASATAMEEVVRITPQPRMVQYTFLSLPCFAQSAHLWPRHGRGFFNFKLSENMPSYPSVKFCPVPFIFI